MPPRVYFGLKLIIFLRKITDDYKPYKRKNIRAVFNSCFCFECRLPVMEDLDYLGPDDDRIDHNSAITDEEFIKLRTSLLVNCVLNAIFSLIAAAGNGVILLVIWKTSTLHTPSNSLLFGLALTDFFVGLLTQPLYLGTRLVYVVSKENNPLALSNAFDVLSSVLSGASFSTATVISIERYLVFRLHMRYHAIVTIRKVIVVIAVVWLLSSVWAFMWMYNRQVFYYSGFSLTTACLIVLAVMYLKIYQIVRRHRAQIMAQNRWGAARHSKVTSHLFFSRWKRSAVNTFYICILIFLSSFPWFCTAAVIQVTGHSLTKQIVLEFTGSITFINSSLNPFFYYWRVSEIREAIKRRIKRRFPSNRLQAHTTQKYVARGKQVSSWRRTTVV